MQINVNGNKIGLREFRELDEITNQAFLQLITSFLNDPNLDYGNLANE